jgi:hypothetical protein
MSKRFVVKFAGKHQRLHTPKYLMNTNIGHMQVDTHSRSTLSQFLLIIIVVYHWTSV